VQQGGGAQTYGDSLSREFTLRYPVQLGVKRTKQRVRSRVVATLGSSEK
jgi:hypothetical protein